MDSPQACLVERLATLRRHNPHQPQDRRSTASESKTPSICVHHADGRTCRYSIDQPVYLVGSSAECDLVIHQARLAEVQFYLYQARGKVTLGVVSTAPPVRLNGRIVTRAILSDGAEICTGGITMKVDVPTSLTLFAPFEQQQSTTETPTVRARKNSSNEPCLKEDTSLGLLLKDVGRWLAHQESAL